MSKKRSLAALCLILALVEVSSVGAADGTPPAFQMPAATESVPRPDDLAAAGEPNGAETVLYSNAKVEIERYGTETVTHVYPLEGADALCPLGDIEPNSGSPPQLSGTPSPGNVLTVSNGSWIVCGPFSVSYSYRWSTGVSSQSYLVQSSDVGRQVNATVTACTSEDCAAASSNTVTITDSGGGGGGGGGGSSNPCSENDPSQLFSQFVGMTAVPASVVAGQSFSVSITFRNAGQCTWTGGGGYRLGSQSPENNTNWGFNRVYLAVGESVAPGQSKTFVLNAQAPSTPGSYGFQWRMVREFVNWFGPSTPNATITVSSPQPTCVGTVVLYDGPSFTGNCWSYGPGEYPSLADAHDRGSSIKVAEGYAATLFAGTDYVGGWVNTGTATDASGWSGVGDNNASAMVVQQIPLPEQLANFSSVAPPAESRTNYPNGCWRVWDGFSAYTVYGRRSFTYKLSTNFCKKSGTITSVNSRDITIDIPAFQWPLRLVTAWRYNQAFWEPGGAGDSSTILKVQGVFDLCVFKYGCTNPYDTWIKIELYGNGQAICTNSMDQNRRNCARQVI